MTHSANTTETVDDRVKLDFFFDVAKMQAEIEALDLQDFVYYDSVPLRAPAHLVDTTLPDPPPAFDFADGSWTDWLDTPLLKKCPYISSIADTFRAHTKVNLIRLLRLAPGAEVKEHTDPTLGLHIKKSMIRLTIPIFTNDAVEFYLNGTTIPLQLGECWYLRLTDRHKIINAGSTARINLTIDVIPNDWMRSKIMEA